MAQEIFGDLTLSSLQIKKQNSNTNFPLFNLEGNANIGSDTSVINIIGELKYKHIIDWYYLNSLTPVLMIDTTDLATSDQASAMIADGSRHTLMLNNNNRMNILHFTNVLASTASALSQLTTLTLGDNTETATESGINLQMDSANILTIQEYKSIVVLMQHHHVRLLLVLIKECQLKQLFYK